MDKEKTYNSTPTSQSARSLFARMMEHIKMDVHQRNLIVCKTLVIPDEDIDNMVEDSGLTSVCQDGETRH